MIEFDFSMQNLIIDKLLIFFPKMEIKKNTVGA